MKLDEYRSRRIRQYPGLRAHNLSYLVEARERMRLDLSLLRSSGLYDWGMGLLLEGAATLDEAYAAIEPILEEQCRRVPQELTTGELLLASHANLLACAGKPDFTPLFKDRLGRIPVGRGAREDSDHVKTLMGIALGVKNVYRATVAPDLPLQESMSLITYRRGALTPRAFLAHLASAVEARAAIEEVWPAFSKMVREFPELEGKEQFDSICLFWAARIVHHQIGGQPLGGTADWLHRHFHAWADGGALPPLHEPQ